MLQTWKMLALIFILSGSTACSRHQAVGGNMPGGIQRIYALTELEADAVANEAIVSSFPGRRIESINGAIKGYSTYTRMALDTFTQQVLIKPVTGKRADGVSVDGYVFEVSGSGTAVLSGTAANVSFANNLQAAADGTSRGVDVVSFVPRLAGASGRQQGQGSGGVEAQQLKKLRELLEQGLISGPEYEAKRRSILEQL